ncbi:PREDICTED: probable disease resistance RPP8-like protein 2 isoform X1 [Camelina sativa]|uniref:Probable disease resistance RPP8-like protein 2 isoform X1 n=1 Tax=Camelina sativa TaxID=90675 RepID=A0ABM1RIT5_CAMSA|nr:PREDICTED: probable disease resistance RPP8-like protein 2 isoform X1 [Camelina sativa]
MVEGVVSFGVQKLWELLSRESHRLQGVEDQVSELKHQIGTLQSLLEDADAKRLESKRVNNFLEDVKDIVYDAEDIFETFLLKEERGKEKGIRRRTKRFACFLVDLQKMGSDIKDLTMRISEVVGRMQGFGIQQIIDGGHSPSVQDRQREQREFRQTFPNNYESDLVGVEKIVDNLVGHLVENDSIQMVSISGMGGIGKSTLARQVFHHDMVRRHFDGFAWICVSQEFTQKHIWQRILQELRPHDKAITHVEELQSKLFQLLETDRYFIVLDDIWKEEDWDRRKTVFPKKSGLKMLVTSRNEGVGLHADPTCFAFRPKILTPEESWKLCKRIVFPRRDETGTLSDLIKVDEGLEALGNKMVTYCGGLPLAVKVLGGLLAMKQTVTEWKRVCDSIGPQIIGAYHFDDKNLNPVFRVLSLSYENLPRCLKHCFLYLAHYPEDYKINVTKLFSYWAAEGIITSFYNGATIRDSAEGYLEELVRRNMVIAEKSYLTTRIEYFHMHDMMREVCLSNAREENFLQVIKVPESTSTFNAQSSSRARRLAVHSGSDALHMLGDKKNKKARSLLLLGVEEDFWIQSSPGSRRLPLLRVLDLSGVKFEGGKLPSSIGKLIHLRFLSLFNARVSYLPSSLRKLKLLLHLNLSVSAESVYVPNVLKEMQELRYLSLPASMCNKTMLELGDLVHLETLWFFSTKHSIVTDLLCMSKLRALYVCFTDGCTSESLTSSLRELRNLEKLSLYVSHKISLADNGGEFVLDFIHLKDLVLCMHMPRFPDQYRFPPHLAHIGLFECRMEEDPMLVLEKLLHLKSVVLTFGAFVGKRMVCSKGGFPQLCALELCAQYDLEEWMVEEGSMPCLHTLTIIECKKLKDLPDQLRYITSLKELQMKGMTTEWKVKLVPGGEDYYKVQHIPSVQIIKCDDE